MNSASSFSHELLQHKTKPECGFCISLALQLPYNCRVLSLALDTSSPTGSLAVLRDNTVLGLIGTSSDENFSSRFFRQLQFLLDELNIALDRFDLFSVVAGPGSFTGLRVGLAAAKGWAEVRNRPIAAISALEAVASQASTHANLVIPVLDARRGQFFLAAYKRSVSQEELVLEGDECLATPEEFGQALRRLKRFSGAVVATPSRESTLTLISQLDGQIGDTQPIAVEEVSPILAPSVGRLGFLRAKSGRLTDSLSLDANYIRRSDAELHLKAPIGP